MNKIVLLFSLVAVIFFYNNNSSIAKGCDEWCTPWIQSSQVVVIGDCSFTVFFEYCVAKWMYKITGYGPIEGPGCYGLLTHLVFNEAHKAIVLAPWTDPLKNKVPEGDCLYDVITGHSAACWKLVSGGPGSYSFTVCDENSCCITRWNLCKFNGQFVALKHSVGYTNECDPNLSEGCFVVCDE